MTQNSDSTRFYSQKQEKRVATRLDLKQVANSGATVFNKGDLRDELLLVECKTSIEPKKSITVHKEWLTKIKEEAFDNGKEMGILVFDFGDGVDYVVTEIQDFATMYEMYKNDCKGE